MEKTDILVIGAGVVGLAKKMLLVQSQAYRQHDLPPKKWTQRRVGVSIKAGLMFDKRRIREIHNWV